MVFRGMLRLKMLVRWHSFLFLKFLLALVIRGLVQVPQMGHSVLVSRPEQLGAPLGCFLPLFTKEKIWKGEFVDLGTLLVVEEQKKEVPISFFQVGGQRTSSDFNENQPKHQNRNFLKTFCKHL